MAPLTGAALARAIKDHVEGKHLDSGKALEEWVARTPDGICMMVQKYGQNWKKQFQEYIDNYALQIRMWQATCTYAERVNAEYREGMSTEQGRNWIYKWLEKQRIDKYVWINAVETVMNKTHPKKNTLVMVGISNSCKSLMSKIITAPYTTGLVVKQGLSSSPFNWQNLRYKNLAVVEEPLITPTEVETYKLLMGGERLEVQVKGQDMWELDRTPMVMTANGVLSKWVNAVDLQAMINRTFYFECNYEMEPDCQITEQDWYAVYRELSCERNAE